MTIWSSDTSLSYFALRTRNEDREIICCYGVESEKLDELQDALQKLGTSPKYNKKRDYLLYQYDAVNCTFEDYGTGRFYAAKTVLKDKQFELLHFKNSEGLLHNPRPCVGAEFAFSRNEITTTFYANNKPKAEIGQAHRLVFRPDGRLKALVSGSEEKPKKIPCETLDERFIANYHNLLRLVCRPQESVALPEFATDNAVAVLKHLPK